MRQRGGVGIVLALLAGLNASAARADELSLRPAHLVPSISTPEAGLWGASDEAERHVKTSAELDRDPALTAYVRSVVCRVASVYCDELRVYVLDRPVFNAAAAPNGYVEVNSGLLLRARTEDELAFVLGHEVSHFARNHTLERWNHVKTTANVMLALQIGVTAGAAAAMYSTAASGAPNAGQSIRSISDSAQALNNLIYLSGLAAIFSYGRDEETEADKLGFQRASAAGYDKAAGARMWKEMVAETQGSDFPKVRKSGSRASMFNTHPLTQDRIDALEAMGGKTGAPDDAAQRQYRAVVRPHLADWLRDDLRRRDYGQTLVLIDRLSEIGEDQGVLLYFRAEALRQRRGDGDQAAATQAYRASVQHPDAPAAAWRELGDAMSKAKDQAAAKAAYQGYLAKAAADADDRWLVEANLKTITDTETK